MRDLSHARYLPGALCWLNLDRLFRLPTLEPGGSVLLVGVTAHHSAISITSKNR